MLQIRDGAELARPPATNRAVDAPSEEHLRVVVVVKAEDIVGPYLVLAHIDLELPRRQWEHTVHNITLALSACGKLEFGG